MTTGRSVFDASIESARIFESAAAHCAAGAGLFEALSDFRTPAELVARMGFHTAKQGAIIAFLEMLTERGFLERSPRLGEAAYRTLRHVVVSQQSVDGGIQPHRYRREILAPWFAESHAELIRSANVAFLGENLSLFRSPDGWIKLDGEWTEVTRKNLANPLYDFGRMLAVRALVSRGHRFLDLACGPGMGVRQLSEWSEATAEIVGVDISEDLLGVARQLVYPGARVRFVRHDLNAGLPPLPAEHFDGAMIVGALHYVRDKVSLLSGIRRRLRNQGILAIANCFVEGGFGDEAKHRFYTSLLDLDVWIDCRSEIRRLVSRSGFRILDELDAGSQYTVLAECDGRPEATGSEFEDAS